MESLKGIKIHIDECIKQICNICDDFKIGYKIKRNGKNVNIELIGNGQRGLLRIYSPPKGLTIDPSAGKNKELNIKILEEFKKRNSVEKVVNSYYKYERLTCEQIIQVKKSLLRFCEEYGHTVKENKKQYEEYRFKITNTETNESVNVIQYSNGTLEIRGLRWNLWEDICYLIEKVINPPISGIIHRLSNQNEHEVDNENINKNKGKIIDYLSLDLANYLYTYDLDVIISCQCIIDSKIVIPDYSCVIAPAYRALEGYFKKVLIDLKIVKTIELDNKWDFGRIFYPNRQLKKEYHNFLNKDTHIRNSQLDILSKLCHHMWTFRNPMSHSGPKPPLIVPDFDDCEKRFKEILNIIKASYSILITNRNKTIEYKCS